MPVFSVIVEHCKNKKSSNQRDLMIEVQRALSPKILLAHQIILNVSSEKLRLKSAFNLLFVTS